MEDGGKIAVLGPRETPLLFFYKEFKPAEFAKYLQPAVPKEQTASQRELCYVKYPIPCASGRTCTGSCPTGYTVDDCSKYDYNYGDLKVDFSL